MWRSTISFHERNEAYSGASLIQSVNLIAFVTLMLGIILIGVFKKSLNIWNWNCKNWLGFNYLIYSKLTTKTIFNTFFISFITFHDICRDFLVVMNLRIFNYLPIYSQKLFIGFLRLKGQCQKWNSQGIGRQPWFEVGHS